MHLRKMVGRVIISLKARKIKVRDAVAGWIVFPILIVFFFQAEDGIRDSDMWLEFRRVLFRSPTALMSMTGHYAQRSMINAQYSRKEFS